METIQKFQDLLKRLFQFETSDLDFGIYRILNYKRERLKKFIQEDLRNKVESAFAKKGHKYAIPYNGEEVKLYWANNEQYYTKTGLLFRDYTFKANDYQVIFRIVSARQELGSKRATKQRFFILDDENPVESKDKALIIRLEYRELIEEEVKSHGVEGGSNTAKQEKINQKTYDEILSNIKDITVKALLSKEYKNEKPLLLYQISRFTAKNTKDYFIHKNLKKFLSEQLDYFIKAEVLDIETLEKERFLDKHITRAKVVREIGENIIDFLSQIEDFQKRLWEKKKFVLKTEYVITTDRVPEELHQEIWTNKGQRNEWKDLGFEIPKTKEDLKKRTLPIDTKYYAQEFKEKLLERITSSPIIARSDSDEAISLDDLLDGILIKSENWQALNLILGKYKEKVQTIYIDPPFKTGQDFLYKDKYQDSSWITLMGNRLNVAIHFLNNRGNIFVHLDWNANFLGRQLLGKLFPEITEIIWNTNATKDEEAGLFQYKSFGKKYVRQHDTIFQCAKIQDYKFLKLWKPNRRTTNLSIGWLDLISYPRIPNPKNLKDYEFYVEKYNHNAIFELQELQIKEKVFPIGDIWNDIYSFTQSEMRVSENVSFDTQKPENLLRRIIQSTSVKEDIVMDFFAGSGTTLAVAHKLKRKWIGVEMADFFQEFYFNKGERKVELKGRLKIVLQGDKEFTAVNKNRRSHLSKDINWQGGGFFKYHILEQYEDTLDNIELTPNRQAELKFGDDYLLKYFLDYETRGNPNLLNIDQLKDPFSYKLKVNLEEVGEPQEVVVDIPETFNYLLGLKVKKIKAREIASPSARNDKKRKYLFILGEKEGKDIAIVWREYDDNWSENDFKEDKEFIIKELEPWASHIVYVNGQSILTPKFGKHTAEIRYIEPEFKRLMER